MTLTYCGITAEAALWAELGMRPYANVPFEEKPCREGTAHNSAPTDGELIEARITSGSAGDEALVWLIRERRQRAEERARNYATMKAADEAVHAARIRRQAARLELKAKGLSEDDTDAT